MKKKATITKYSIYLLNCLKGVEPWGRALQNGFIFYVLYRLISPPPSPWLCRWYPLRCRRILHPITLTTQTRHSRKQQMPYQRSGESKSTHGRSRAASYAWNLEQGIEIKIMSWLCLSWLPYRKSVIEKQIARQDIKVPSKLKGFLGKSGKKVVRIISNGYLFPVWSLFISDVRKTLEV